MHDQRRVGSWKNRPTFEELAVMFEGSTTIGSERAYRKAMEHLTTPTKYLVADGAAVRLKRSAQSDKKKITTAVFQYQVDFGGEWVEIPIDF